MARTPFNRTPVKAKTNSRKAKELIVPVSTWRYKMIGLIFGGIFCALITRAMYLQIIDTDYLQSQGDARYLRVQKEMPTRGMIVDRNGQPLAISSPVDSIWMHPSTILQQKGKYSYDQLTKLLGISRENLLSKAESKKTRQFVYLKRHLPPQLAKQILELNVPGINSVREYKRYYPAGPVMAHVLGFTNIDNEGQEGVELAYDKQLKGLPGRTRVLQDKVGHVVEYVEQLSRVQHGEDIVLSLDARIQYLAYRYLQATVKKNQASSASLVALDAKTGEILAMVSAPDFNPNDRSDLKSTQFRNRAIADSFEPGSTVKPFTVAMALEEGVVEPETVIDTEKGFFYIGRNRVNDTKPHGKISVSEVIKVSSNIGSAKIAMMMKPRDLYQTYADVGYGATNKLKLQGEQKGILANRKKWKPIEHATMSYGYGLSVNTLQLARSYLALANKGVLLPVSLHPVDKTPRGERVFSQQTMQQVALMLEAAVSDEGTAPKARVNHYRVGGKTGTAHRVVDGRYQDDSYMSLFAGYAPISDPEIVLVVLVNDPKGIDYYGGLVAAPVFANVMSGALRFRDVVPDALQSPAAQDPAELIIARPVVALNLQQARGG
ncbi:MAG: cell division protein FtsI (penicillin-binding protein 3) [Cryomorphaceae bacterium]|jgi:cell division protein FtsI (penicillin-binding protein 3)